MLRQLLEWASGAVDPMQRVRRAVQEARFRPNVADHKSISFLVPLEDRKYDVMVCLHDGGEVSIGTTSNVKFPPDGIPPGVENAVQQRSRADPHIYWRPVHGLRCSSFMAICIGRLSDLNAATLQAAVVKLVPEVAFLDQCLETAGYA